MSRSPEQDFSPEQQHAYRQITGFFGRAEYEFPAAAFGRNFKQIIEAGAQSLMM